MSINNIIHKQVIAFICVFTVLLVARSYGQNKTMIGFVFGPKYEKYYPLNVNSEIKTPFISSSPLVGKTIGRKIKEIFTVETGVIHMNYGVGYRFSPSYSTKYSEHVYSGYSFYQMPLHLK